MSAIRSLSGAKQTSDNNAEQSRFMSTRPNLERGRFVVGPPQAVD